MHPSKLQGVKEAPLLRCPCRICKKLPVKGKLTLSKRVCLHPCLRSREANLLQEELVTLVLLSEVTQVSTNWVASPNPQLSKKQRVETNSTRSWTGAPLVWLPRTERSSWILNSSSRGRFFKILLLSVREMVNSKKKKRRRSLRPYPSTTSERECSKKKKWSRNQQQCRLPLLLRPHRLPWTHLSRPQSLHNLILKIILNRALRARIHQQPRLARLEAPPKHLVRVLDLLAVSDYLQVSLCASQVVLQAWGILLLLLVASTRNRQLKNKKRLVGCQYSASYVVQTKKI